MSCVKRLASGREVTLRQVLDSREKRAEYQRRLLEAYPGCALVSFTVNMPGPVKDNIISRQVHAYGMALLRAVFGQACLFAEQRESACGYEGFAVIDMPSLEVKRSTCRIEDETPAGRLMDLDVHTAAGQVSRTDLGLPPRTCLICGRAAHECARSRAHSVDTLLEKTCHLFLSAFKEDSNGLWHQTGDANTAEY